MKDLPEDAVVDGSRAALFQESLHTCVSSRDYVGAAIIQKEIDDATSDEAVRSLPEQLQAGERELALSQGALHRAATQQVIVKCVAKQDYAGAARLQEELNALSAIAVHALPQAAVQRQCDRSLRSSRTSSMLA